MKDLAELLARSEAYERHHAQWVAAGHALQAERDGVIALGKTLGFFAGRMQADLPKVPNLRGGAEEVPAMQPAQIIFDSPPCISFSVPRADALASDISAKVAEVDHLFDQPPGRPSVQPDERPCTDMTNDEIIVGYDDIMARYNNPGDCNFEWLTARRFAFEVQMVTRGLMVLRDPAGDVTAKAAE